MASTILLQDIVNSARAYPELNPIWGKTSGFTQEIALSIANDIMQKFLADGLDWKWNRANAPFFYTVALQQDYISNVTDVGWLEQAWRVDINNTGFPTSPLPVFVMEAVRDLARSAIQGSPFQVSWVPNKLALLGTWQANTSYPTGLGAPFTPFSLIQQFKDANGNLLFVTTNGISGNSQPVLPPLSAPGTTVTDNTVVWTVADPNGFAWRVLPLPASSGIVWQVWPVYQKKPPILTSLQNTLAPIPDEFGYLFRSGFLAMCYGHAGAKQFRDMYQLWEEDLRTAIRSGDREREDAVFYPSDSMTGGSVSRSGLPIGPAWPYDYYGGM